MSRYLNHLAALTLHQVEPVQPRLASRFETSVDKGLSGHNGLDVVQESPASMPHEPVQVSTTKGNLEHTKLMQPRQDSQFEIPAVRESSNNSLLDVNPETQVLKQHQPVQPTTINATGKPVAQTGITAPTELPVKKTSSDKNFSLVDKEHVIPAVQSVNKPVDQAFQAARKDGLPTEHLRTIVEHVQEHFTETTYNELVIREVTVPDEKQKIIKPQTSTPPAPVKPVSIKPWSEQPIVGLNSPSHSSNQQLMADPSGSDTTPSPTIQVTIGRIEIRATQVTQKPAKKSYATSNTLNLDEYLKQRNGGKS